mmetsp:Transcript_220/g.335  ORF Transcript_220/g.335 Transcript_220/m.335 type:complete len:886 (-) Transcript_220:85-2742(-)
MVLGEIDTNVSILSDDEDEDYDTAIGNRSRKSTLCMDDDDSEEYLPPLKVGGEQRENDSSSKRKDRGAGKVGKNEKKTPNPKPRKRRRSSARFLRLSGRLSGRFDECGEVGGGKTDEELKEELGKMYQQAIRLNAENKINAGNSWGLKLIENIDKFLGDEEEEPSKSRVESSNRNSVKKGKDKTLNDDKKEKRVNFTKASCTLDASVKIYSYRVDDVHLTSYKVLANLNRTDSGKKNDSTDIDDVHNTGLVTAENESKRNNYRAKIETLESNPANLNTSCLDSAYDIDPIFHKMSQKFDEGGAKGLLLVNLGVAHDGCRIVLDSKEDSLSESLVSMQQNETQTRDVEDGGESDITNNSECPPATSKIGDEGEVNISSLTHKLQELLLGTYIQSMDLVPQLSELRSSYKVLESEGFVNENTQRSQSKRYANDEDDEKAAEESILTEAIERSKMSLGKSSFYLGESSDMNLTGNENECTFGNTDYGDDDNDDNFDNFLAADDNAEKYSSLSFQGSDNLQGNSLSNSLSQKSNAVNFLDALCNGNALNNSNEFDYFNGEGVEKMMSGNVWAGSFHWKKIGRTQVTKKVKKDEKGKVKEVKNGKTNKAHEEIEFVNLEWETHDCLETLLAKQKKASKRTKASTQITNAIQKKQMNEFNLLPPDAEIGIEKLTSLFMRPDANFITSKKESNINECNKSVGFAGIDTFSEYHDDDANSFGDDNDGPGYDIADEKQNSNELNENVFEELVDVRKVEKVRVSYATVSKRVDVKRLKREIWEEVEEKTIISLDSEGGKRSKDVITSDLDTIETDSRSQNEKNENLSEYYTPLEKGVTSFQTTVQALEDAQSQEDVSLAFYFICVLHLANEKELNLENSQFGLTDFIISKAKGEL